MVAQQQSLARCPQGIAILDTFKAAQTCSGPHPQHLVGSREALWAGCKLRWRTMFLCQFRFFEDGNFTHRSGLASFLRSTKQLHNPLKKPFRCERQRHPTTGEVGKHAPAVLCSVRSTRGLLVGLYCRSHECLGHLPKSYHTR